MESDEILKKFADLGNSELPSQQKHNSVSKPTQDDQKFEEIATKALETMSGVVLQHAKLNINGLIKDFDMVNIDEHIVGDAKNYTWTESGNAPSAKISILNEYVLLFLSLEKYQRQKWRKILVI